MASTDRDVNDPHETFAASAKSPGRRLTHRFSVYRAPLRRAGDFIAKPTDVGTLNW